MDDVYKKLAKHLDNTPGGFPPTESGVELRILERLFTKEQAELALHLFMMPEPVESIAERAGTDPETVGKMLAEMSEKGLIVHSSKDGMDLYMQAQFVIGIWEYQVNNLTRELIEDFNEYVPYLMEAQEKQKTKQLRVIPVSEAISADMEVTDYERAEQLIKEQSKIVLAPCICRKEHEMVGKGCGKPIETCLVFGGGAYYPDDKYTDILREMIDGCDIVFDGVTGLETDGGRIEGLRTESGDTITSDLFVSTIDPSVVVDTDEELNYRSMVILGAHVEASERLFPEHVDWGYFPNDYEFTRVTDYEFTPQSIPDDEYILTVEFPCFIGDDVWSQSAEWYEQYLMDFLEEQNIDSELIDAQVRRAPRAYPLPVNEEIEKFNRINEELNSYENMFNLGRVSTYEYIWIKDIVQQAYLTRDEILETADAVVPE